MSVLAGLLCAAAFFFLLWFNQEGQLSYAPEPYQATRVWILRGVEGRGLGYSTTRPLPGATTRHVCALTTVGFFFLGRGAAESNTDYCECFARTDDGWTLVGGCPE